VTCEPCPCQSCFSRQSRPSRLSQDDTTVRLREDGGEGVIDGLTKLVVSVLAAIQIAERSIASTWEIQTGHLQLRTICWSQLIWMAWC